jgi:hypothetical protein
MGNDEQDELHRFRLQDLFDKRYAEDFGCSVYGSNSVCELRLLTVYVNMYYLLLYITTLKLFTAFACALADTLPEVSSTTPEKVEATVLTGIQVFLAPAGPGTTPLYSYTLGTDTNATTDRVFGSKILNPALQLLAGNTYYVVNTLSAAITTPSGGQIEDYASYSSIFDYLTDGISNCGSVIDNGSGGWTVSNAYIPGITLTPIDFPTAASGGSFIF